MACSPRSASRIASSCCSPLSARVGSPHKPYPSSASPSPRRSPLSPPHLRSRMKGHSQHGSKHNSGNQNRVVITTTAGIPKRRCACSPSTHPGAFRCALHRNKDGESHQPSPTRPRFDGRLRLRKIAMANSLARVCGKENHLVKRLRMGPPSARPDPIRIKSNFRPRPSRLSMM